MAQTQLKPMTADEFLVWHQSQALKYELVDGIPVRHRAMSGGSTAHSSIAANVIATLMVQLRSTRCRPLTSDVAVRTSISQVRYPDVTIDGAPADARTFEARNPIVVFEVLSPTTRATDLQIKLAEYMRHHALKSIVLIDPEFSDVIVYRRDDKNQWQLEHYEAADARFSIPGTEATLALSQIYDGLAVTAPPADRAM